MDSQIRLAAFDFLEKRSLFNDGNFTRNELEQGFNYKGERITLIGPPGIWKPRTMSLPLSITTTSNSPYDDSSPMEGFLDYKYRGIDPYHRDNVGLRELMKNQIPLIYFHSIVPSEYDAYWPVFIQEDYPEQLTFKVAISDKAILSNRSLADPGLENIRREYMTTQVKVRLHQKAFRERVLRAYSSRCTLCALKHKPLLDAAHIVPDAHEEGSPSIQNGLSLCKIHHAAFDHNIIGITPDYNTHVREDVLEEIDGPMLKHGIQSLHGNNLILPNNEEHWPDREKLDFRYKKFRNVG